MKLYFVLLIVVVMSTAGSCFADFSSMQSSMRPIGNGQIRYMGLFKEYDASLSASPGATAEDILDTEISKCLFLHYAVPLTIDIFNRGAEMVLQRQHGEGELRAVRQQIDALHAQYQDVQEGDSYTLCFDSGSSMTTLSLNNEELVRIVSVDFARFYFGIWLGPDAPLDEDLRDDLLAANR